MNDYEIDKVLFFSFRYALGRMTYVVGDVCDLLIKYKDKLSDFHKDLIKKEITLALRDDKAGMEWDRAQWEILLHKMQK